MAIKARPPTISGLEQLATGSLFRRLIDDLNALVQKQILLARQEADANLREVTSGGKILAVGVVFLLAAFVSLVALIISLLALLMPLWVAALVALVVFGAIGGMLAYAGNKRVRVQPLSETRATLREDVTWARQSLRPDGR